MIDEEDNEDLRDAEAAPEIDTGNPRKFRAAKKAQAEEDLVMDGFWEAVLKTEAGRAVLWNILETCGIHRSGMAPDPHHMAFVCGKREVGVKLEVDILTRNAQAFTLMASEAEIRKQRKTKRGKV